MKHIYRALTAFCFISFLLVSTGMAFFSFDNYSMVRNTTSHLAAQGSPFAWLMNLVFVCLGTMAILTSYASQVRYHQVTGGIFGFSLIMTAFFPHAPLVAGASGNLLQDQLHSIFASTTGMSFTLLALGHGLMSRGRQRVAGIILAFLATLISLCMLAFPSFMGLLQRFMFVSAFGWLFFYMEPPRQHQISSK